MKHFRVINPRSPLAPGSRAPGCPYYEELPVCESETGADVVCNTELYRGCHTGENDCADCRTGLDNSDDECCAGTRFFGPGDNIDHLSCFTNDAATGSFCRGGWGDDACGFSEEFMQDDCTWGFQG